MWTTFAICQSSGIWPVSQDRLRNFNNRLCSKAGAHFITLKFNPSVPWHFIFLQHCTTAKNSHYSQLLDLHFIDVWKFCFHKFLLVPQPLIISEPLIPVSYTHLVKHRLITVKKYYRHILTKITMYMPKSFINT